MAFGAGTCFNCRAGTHKTTACGAVFVEPDLPGPTQPDRQNDWGRKRAGGDLAKKSRVVTRFWIRHFQKLPQFLPGRGAGMSIGFSLNVSGAVTTSAQGGRRPAEAINAVFLTPVRCQRVPAFSVAQAAGGGWWRPAEGINAVFLTPVRHTAHCPLPAADSRVGSGTVGGGRRDRRREAAGGGRWEAMGGTVNVAGVDGGSEHEGREGAGGAEALILAPYLSA
ncbi:hypothetical protein GGX14DRAFT_397898 [Mycena pura]|uniref:Uncharacterized protein n=1 Tax=Mycena pura TaxID=153505 RepID=A0AAD6V7A0_9AGAR|nr:hypothetical protein GGX14DRAFT_397898 [Mycena pura]